MIQTTEAVGNVPLDEPTSTRPRLLDLRQRGVTSFSRSKAVGSVAELRFVVRLKNKANYLLQQLIRPGRESERALPIRVWFLDVDAPGWPPPVAFMTQSVNDCSDFGQGHPVHGFFRGAGGHGTGITIDLSVGFQVQLGVEQQPIDALQWQSSSATVTDDVQDRFGVTHLAYLAFLTHL